MRSKLRNPNLRFIFTSTAVRNPWLLLFLPLQELLLSSDPSVSVHFIHLIRSLHILFISVNVLPLFWFTISNLYEYTHLIFGLPLPIHPSLISVRNPCSIISTAFPQSHLVRILFYFLILLNLLSFRSLLSLSFVVFPITFLRCLNFTRIK